MSESGKTIVVLSGGSLGSERMHVRCNLADATSPVEVDYGVGEGWVGSAFRCAETRHRKSGLVEIAKILAAAAIEVPDDQFECNHTFY